jgi:hypothetical protein
MNKSRNNSLIGGLGILAHPSCVLMASERVKTREKTTKIAKKKEK